LSSRLNTHARLRISSVKNCKGVTTGKGDWAWLQHTLACLDDHGRAAVVLDTGAVTRGSGSKNEDKERNIRKWFVDRDLIDGVILLPDNLFYNTSAAGVIVVLSKRKPPARKDRIFLLNASRRVKKGKPKNYIPEDAIRPLAAAYLKGEPVQSETAVITRQQAEEAEPVGGASQRYRTAPHQGDRCGAVARRGQRLLLPAAIGFHRHAQIAVIEMPP
jgi:type I restriction enzyme M protein